LYLPKALQESVRHLERIAQAQSTIQLGKDAQNREIRPMQEISQFPRGREIELIEPNEKIRQIS
jgi:hypothetical protein